VLIADVSEAYTVTTAARIYGKLHFLPERGPAISGRELADVVADVVSISRPAQ
jgi:hypothetical protein